MSTQPPPFASPLAQLCFQLGVQIGQAWARQNLALRDAEAGASSPQKQRAKRKAQGPAPEPAGPSAPASPEPAQAEAPVQTSRRVRRPRRPKAPAGEELQAAPLESKVAVPPRVRRRSVAAPPAPPDAGGAAPGSGGSQAESQLLERMRQHLFGEADGSPSEAEPKPS